MTHPAVLVKQAWRLYFANSKILLIITLPIAVLGTVLNNLIILVNDPLNKMLPGSIWPALLTALATVIIVAAWLAAGLACYAGAKKIIAGQKTDPREVYAFAWSRFWPVLWVSILRNLIVLGGLLLLIVPGIIWALRYAFAEQVALFEGKRGMAALRRSREMTNGKILDLLLSIISLGAVFAAFSVVAITAKQSVDFLLSMAVYGMLAESAADIVSLIMWLLLTVAAAWIISPFAQLFTVMLYEELAEARKPLPTPGE